MSKVRDTAEAWRVSDLVALIGGFAKAAEAGLFGVADGRSRPLNLYIVKLECFRVAISAAGSGKCLLKQVCRARRLALILGGAQDRPARYVPPAGHFGLIRTRTGSAELSG